MLTARSVLYGFVCALLVSMTVLSPAAEISSASLPDMRNSLVITPDPDILLEDDFTSVPLSGQWQTPFNAARVQDPDDAGNHVIRLGGVAGEYAQLETVDAYGDFTLEYRLRFDTPWGAYPYQDGVHFPTAGFKIGNYDFQLAYVWNVYLLTGAGTAPLLASKEQWHTYTITKNGNLLSIYYNHNLLIEQRYDDLAESTILFYALHADVWLDEIRLVAHPEAYLYDTFHEGLLAVNWDDRTGWSTVTDSGGNQALYTAAASGYSSRIRTVIDEHEDYVLRFKAKQELLGLDGDWEVMVRGDGDAGVGIRHRIGLDWSAGEFSSSGYTPTGTPVTTDLPADGEWHDYIVVVNGGRYSVFKDGELLLQENAGVSGAGFTGFRARNAALWLDDVLIAPLYSPEYVIRPFRYGHNYAVSDEKGLSLRVVNGDFMAHDYEVSYTVYDASDNAVDEGTDEIHLLPEQIRNDWELEVAVGTPGSYELKVVLTSDGRTVASYASPLIVLTDLSERYPFYESKFGFAIGSAFEPHFASLQELAGFPNMRANISEEAEPLPDDEWDFSVAEAAWEQMQQHGIQLVNTSMDLSGLGNLLNLRSAYGDKMAAIAEHFAGEGIAYELWNEPNHDSFWPTSPTRMNEVTSLFKAVSNRIKQVDKEALILGPAYSMTHPLELRKQFSQGLYDYIDVLTYHPYEFPNPPESIIAPRFLEMKAEVDRYGGWLEHQLTEQGYTTSNGYVGVTEEQQAQYLVRTELIGTSIDAMRAIHLYNLQNTGNDPNDFEHGLGSVRSDGTAKPAYIALSNMARQLVNADYVGQLDLGTDKYGYVYRKYDGNIVVATWSASGTATVQIPMLSAPEAQYDMYGVELTPVWSAGMLNIALNGSPIYTVLGNSNGMPLLLEAARQFREEKAAIIQSQLAEIAELLVRSELEAAFADVDEAAETMLGMSVVDAGIAADGLEDALDALYALAADLSDAMGEENVERELAYALAESMHYYAYGLAKPQAALLRVAGAVSVPSLTETGAEVAAAASAVNTAAGALGQLTVPERMLRWAERFYRHAEDSAVVKPEMARVFSALAVHTAGMAEGFAAQDEPFARFTVLDVFPKLSQGMSGSTRSLTVLLDNGYDSVLNATIELEYPAVWGLSTVSSSATVAVGDTWQGAVNVTVPVGVAPGSYTVIIRAKKGSEEIRSQEVLVEVTSV